MPSPSIPPLLLPYTSLPPEHSLVLLTGVLQATTNWLLVQFIAGALANGSNGALRARGNDAEVQGSAVGEEQYDVAVVLVSFMRDYEFWRTECKRAGAADLSRLAQRNRFAFIDGLTTLFLPQTAIAPPNIPSAKSTTPIPSGIPAPRTIPTRTPVQPVASRRQPQSALPASTANAKSSASKDDVSHLSSSSPEHLESAVTTAVTRLKQAANNPSLKVLLILDAPDMLLATAPQQTQPIYQAPTSSTAEAATPLTLAAALMALRHKVHATILSCSADSTLLTTPPAANAQSCSGPLETAHSAFLIGQAHSADLTMSLRMLDTGFADDVSGVVRITPGAGWNIQEQDHEWKEQELLYHVKNDASVRVFHRGEGV